MENAEKERFELAMLDEYVVLFTCARIDRKTVPEDLFCYDVRHDDDCQGIACEIKPYVAVNHWGTILTKTEIPMADRKAGGMPACACELMELEGGKDVIVNILVQRVAVFNG